jgi:regulator of ribonuclease activity A
MSYSTARLCDAYSEREHFQVAEPIFNAYGASKAFSGQITTLKTFEDDGLVRIIVSEKVENRVLVIDAGGSRRCALIDEELAKLAVDHGWQGLVIYGCIRDSERINQLAFGIRALQTYPLKGHKKEHGERDVMITFAGVNFKKDHFLYADADGIIVSESMLS